MKKLIFTLVILLLVFGINAQTLYWSGTNTWNTTGTNKDWGTLAAGPYNTTAFTNGANANFVNTAGT
ncbi:MAG: hypothetical protein JWO06_3750, partial [Bacteroidota bacterium]|nr:hypothetical protein [Bacteroidota bacterium]